MKISLFALFSVLALTWLAIPVSSTEGSGGKSSDAPSVVSDKTASDKEAAIELSKLPLRKTLTPADISAEKSINISAVWHGKKEKYSGVPLRLFFKEMLAVPLETMPAWKELSKQELVMEVTGKDGYPGLITGTELAINTSGDKFVLFTKHDDQSGTDTVNLICRNDEFRVRCVQDIVRLRIIAIPKDPIASKPAAGKDQTATRATIAGKECTRAIKTLAEKDQLAMKPATGKMPSQ